MSISFGKNKRAVLVDIAEGRVGIYAGQTNADKDGYVNVFFYPYNDLGRVIFKNPVPIPNVPSTGIYRVTSNIIGEPGVPEEFVIIIRSTLGNKSLLDKIDVAFKTNVEKLEEQLRSNIIERESLKREVKKAKSGAKEGIKDLREMQDLMTGEKEKKDKRKRQYIDGREDFE